MRPSWVRLNTIWTRSLDVRWKISVICLAALILHLGLRFASDDAWRTGLDGIAFGLIALGLSPWIARVIQSFKFGGVEVSLREQIEEQKHDIEALKFLFTNFLGPYELHHLESLANHVPFEVDVDHYPENLRGELTRLRRIGLIAPYEGKSVNAIYADPRKTKSLHEFFYATDAGRNYLKKREEMNKEA